MDRRSRLMATLRGEGVDRPPISFYEINGLDEDVADQDPFNIYTHPSWKPLIDLAREKTDRIVMRSVPFSKAGFDPLDELSTVESSIDRYGSLIQVRTVRCVNRELTAKTRRDPDVNTIWHTEHLLKDVEDLRAYLSLPMAEPHEDPQIQGVLDAETALGDSGIVLVDTPDPLCIAAELFHMADYAVIAMTEPLLFRQLLDRIAATLLPQTEAVAQALPGRLWRIYGPEYASPPFLPPRLFGDYVANYDRSMVDAIQRHGGFARIHCHGNINLILDDIASTGCVGLDPIEPPPQGDVSLRYVRQKCGAQMVLFGNLEASELEFLPSDQFSEKVKRALDEGTSGPGRGFVLMPSSCPYGRQVPDLALRNYEVMVEAIEKF